MKHGKTDELRRGAAAIHFNRVARRSCNCWYLGAIAITQFVEMRAQAYDMSAVVNMKSIIKAEEAKYVETEQYMRCNAGGCESFVAPFVASKGDREDVSVLDTQGVGANYFVIACHQLGEKYFYWASMVHDYGAVHIPAGIIVDSDVDVLGGCSMAKVINPLRSPRVDLSRERPAF